MEKLLGGLQVEDGVKIPRCYLPNLSESIQLIGFCDASIKAYAATVYLHDQSKCCSLVTSKRRVAPMPMQTVPRLELLGAVLLARLIVSVRNNLGDIVTECKCFTDSTIVLHWIKGTDRHWKPFVQNRVKEIRECFQ